MKKLFLVLWLLVMAAVALGQCPIKAVGEKIAMGPLQCLDTLGRTVTPDSIHITTYKDDGTTAAFFVRSTTAPFSDISIDTTKPAIGGTAPVRYWYVQTISTIDGTASNSQMAVDVTMWWKNYDTQNRFCVQMVADSLTKAASLVIAYVNATISSRSTFAPATDSVNVDGSALSGLNNIIKSNSFGAGAIDANALASSAASEINDSTRDALGDTVGTFASPHALTDSMRLVAHDSSRAFVQGVKDKTDSLRFAGVLQNPSFLQPSTSGRRLDVAAGGEAGIDLDNASGTLDSTETGGTFKKMIALRSDSGAVAGGTVTTYPSLERIAIVDAAGAIPKFQFVIDTTAIGGSSEYALLNKAVMVRDADDGKWFGRGVFERINCVGDLCTLQVADSLPFAVEAGDSVFIKGDEPVYVIASLSEAAAAVASTSLEGAYADSTLGGLLKLIAEGAGASGFDSTLFLEMMQAHGWYATFDSLGLRVTRGNSFSLPLAGDLFTQAQYEAFSLNIGKIKGSSTLVVDSARNAGSLTLTDENIDSIAARTAALIGASGSGDCGGSDGTAFTCFFVDTLGTDELVGDGRIWLFTNSACTGDAAYWGTTGPGGFVSFSVDTGYYWAIASKMGAVTASAAQQFHVTGPLTDSVLAYGFATSTRAVIVGLVNLSGGPDTVCAYCPVSFEMTSAGGNIRDTVLNVVIIPSTLQGYIDASGQPVAKTGVPFELRKTQNLVSTVGQTKYPVKWVMKVTQEDGSIWQSNAFSISNATTTVDIGDI